MLVFRRHFGSSRDPSTRLEFPLHLPSRQLHQDSFRVRFLFAVYIAWPLLLVALSSSVGNLVVLDLVRSLWWNMGTKLGSHMQNLWEDFPAAERHSVRLFSRQK